nr:hypothetical protein [Tanacetum cinerariifolium]
MDDSCSCIDGLLKDGASWSIEVDTGEPIGSAVVATAFAKRNNGSFKNISMVKEYQENDKIKSKPDKNGKRGEAGKSQKQLQWIKQVKLKKMQKEGPKVQSPTSFIQERKEQGLFCNYLKEERGGAKLSKYISFLGQVRLKFLQLSFTFMP